MISDKTNKAGDKYKWIDLTVLKSISDGDELFCNKMIKSFIELLTEYNQSIKEAYHNKNYIELGLLVHKLKPNIELFFGYQQKEEFEQLEKILKDKRVNALDHALESVLLWLEAGRDELKLYLQK